MATVKTHEELARLAADQGLTDKQFAKIFETWNDLTVAKIARAFGVPADKVDEQITVVTEPAPAPSKRGFFGFARPKQRILIDPLDGDKFGARRVREVSITMPSKGSEEDKNVVLTLNPLGSSVALSPNLYVQPTLEVFRKIFDGIAAIAPQKKLAFPLLRSDRLRLFTKEAAHRTGVELTEAAVEPARFVLSPEELAEKFRRAAAEAEAKAAADAEAYSIKLKNLDPSDQIVVAHVDMIGGKKVGDLLNAKGEVVWKWDPESQDFMKPSEFYTKHKALMGDLMDPEFSFRGWVPNVAPGGKIRAEGNYFFKGSHPDYETPVGPGYEKFIQLVDHFEVAKLYGKKSLKVNPTIIGSVAGTVIAPTETGDFLYLGNVYDDKKVLVGKIDPRSEEVLTLDDYRRRFKLASDEKLETVAVVCNADLEFVELDSIKMTNISESLVQATRKDVTIGDLESKFNLTDNFIDNHGLHYQPSAKTKPVVAVERGLMADQILRHQHARRKIPGFNR